MDRDRFSRIAHGDLPLWNPIAVRHLQQYVSRLMLPVDSTVLDIGCGRGHLLRLILSQYDVLGTGVDRSSLAIAEAASAMPALLTNGRLSLIEKRFDPADFPEPAFDLVACIGSSHAVGSYRATLQMAKRLLRPNGVLLVGEGYWKCVPAQEYFDFLKMAADEHTDHHGNQAAGVREGYELIRCSECSLEEWDAYEGTYAHNIEEHVRTNVDDPDADEMLKRIRPWREAYLRWGRDTLGFGLYQFRLSTR